MRPFAGLAMFALLLMLPMRLNAADAPVVRHPFHLPADKAENSLRQLSAQSGLEVVFASGVAEGVRTKAVEGEYEAIEAARLMLADTGLIVRQDVKTGALTVTRAEIAPDPPRGAAKRDQYQPDLPAARSAEEEEKIITLSPFEVTAGATHGYGTDESIGASRVALPVEDVSASIITVNQQLLQDIGPANLPSALRYVSGVAQISANENGRVSIRGYQGATGSEVIDGLPGNAAPGGVNALDMNVYDMFEVIKGPDGVLYGAHVIGGLVNRVTKKPLSVPQYSITTDVTTYADTDHSIDLYRASVDATGPLDSNQKLSYRLITTREDGHGIDGEKQTLFNAAPQLQYNFDSGSFIRFFYQHTQADLPRSTTTWLASDGVPQHFSYPQLNQEPLDDALQKVNFDEFWATFSHSLDIYGTPWSIRTVAGYTDGQHNWLLTDPQPREVIAYDANGQALGGVQHIPSTAPIARVAATNWFQRYFYDRARHWIGDVELTGRFKLGPTDNIFFTGIQMIDDQTITTRYNASSLLPKTGPTGGYQLWPAPVDFGPYLLTAAEIKNPAYFNTQTVVDPGPEFNWAAQENMQLFSGRLDLVGGVRFDTGTGGSTVTKTLTRQTNEGFYYVPSYVTADGTPYNVWTPKLGVVVKPLEGVSLFYNQTQTYEVQGTVDTRLNSSTYGQRFPDQIAQVKEAGIKINLFGRRLTATGSYFHIVESNSLGTFVDTDGSVTGVPGLGYSAIVGEATDKGVELDLAAEPFSGLNVVASVSKLEALTESGARQRNVPQKTWSAFGSYTIRTGWAGGTTFGGGLAHVADRSADTGDTASLPDYTIGQVFIRYARKNWDVQLNIDNVANKTYYSGSTATNSIFYGTPRTTRVQFRYHW